MWPLAGLGLMIFLVGLRQVGGLLLWSLHPASAMGRSAQRWSERALQLASDRVGWRGMTLADSIEFCLGHVEDCLTRRVSTLRFCAQISTLLGFLGTVTGMVRVFQTVAVKGVVTPGDLAGGIQEALFTTVLGLILAVVAFGFAFILERLAARHLRRLEWQILTRLDTESAADEDSTPPESGGKPS
jgi:biopolymer transport protein ExbB/TolQ